MSTEHEHERTEQPRVSRRGFLKLSGAATAATGAAVAASGSRSAEAAASSFADAANGGGDAGSIHARPWWVREVDEPTTEIDWASKERISERGHTVRGPGLAQYVGEERAEEITEIARENKIQRIRDNEPGYTLRDQAFYDAAGNFGFAVAPISFLGPQTAETPEDLGVDPWQGDPVENANMIRAAARHFGAATVGFVELNEDTRKLIYNEDPDGLEVVFEDVDEAYETDEKRVIPEKARWVIVYTYQMSEETMRIAPDPVGAATTSVAYSRFPQIQNSLQDFLRGLGYQGLGEASINALGIGPAFAVLGGLGELGRFNRLITPEYGPMVRVQKMVTDLPLEPTRPIDAGILEFCKSCKLCAEYCPPDALSFEDEPYWEPLGGWSSPGHKAWFEDAPACIEYWRTGPGTNCGICFAVCPYAKKDETVLHSLVKATASRTSLFNGFFTQMDELFGYGERDTESWWGLDLPEYGVDTQRGRGQQA